MESKRLYGKDLIAHCDHLKELAQEFLDGVGKADMEMYRIEKFKPTPVEQEHWGKFYDGDSYVCVCKGQKQYDIHFWEGRDSTSDETGSAAAFTDQLMKILSMPAHSHLELMEEESELFMSRFDGGIKYLHGGCDSGFSHYVAPEHVPELMRVHGDKYPRVFPIEMKASSMNHGDCFVLDMGNNIYVWQGTEANKYEKNAAVYYAQNLKNHEMKSHAEVHFPQTMGGDVEAEFWSHLEGSADDVKEAHAVEEKPDPTEEEKLMYRLWHVREDAEGKMLTDEVKDRPLRRTMLDDTDTYILELYNKVYVWQGHGASDNEKYACMRICVTHKEKMKKPKGTSITRIPQGCEDSLFVSFFEDFYGKENLKVNKEIQ